MNFKTTIVLILILAAAGGWLFFARVKPAGEQTASSTAAGNLLDINATDVTQITVTPANGTAFTLEKSNGNWQLTQPVKAPADSFEVDSLVRAFTDAKTTGSVPASTDASVTGLSNPRDVVELVTPQKTVKLNIGDRTIAGADNFYVQVDGQSQVQLISATDVSDRLGKGPDAYRKMNLVSASADQIKQITITTPATATTPAQTIELQKQGGQGGAAGAAGQTGSWQIVQPAPMPADDTAVSDLTYALTALRADSFVQPAAVPDAALARPQLVVAYSTDAPPAPPPATAPSTQPAWTTITFGRYDDLLKKNVFVRLAGTGAGGSADSIAKVAASTLDSFRKTPLDLRDKTIVDFDPNVVKAISLTTNLPAATQPAGHAPAVTTVSLAKRKLPKAALGPAAPTTAKAGASTRPAATKPAISAAPQTRWIVASNHAAPADDARITTLLTALHPLKADRFLPAAPTTQPAGTYTLTITTTGPFGSNIVEHTLHLLDPGHDAELDGAYDGLHFELPRSLLTDLQGTWEKK